MSSTSISSGVLTPGTVTLATGRGTLNDVIVQPGATVTIYDNTAASGTVLALLVNAGTSTLTALLPKAVRHDIGLTVVTAAANSIVHFGAA
jgi:hypothetical protein